MHMEGIGLMFKKTTRQELLAGQFRNGPNYIGIILSFAIVIIAFLAPIDSRSRIYLLILAFLAFCGSSENDRINEKGYYYYWLCFPVCFLPWERIEQISQTRWNCRTAYIISAKGCRRFEKHTLVETYLLRHPFRAFMISGPNAKNARPIIMKYFGAIDFEEDETTP